MPNNQPVTKIYVLKTLGAEEVFKQLLAIRKEFELIKKAKKETDQALAKADASGNIEQAKRYREELQKIRIEEAEISKQLKQREADLKVAIGLKQLELEKIRAALAIERDKTKSENEVIRQIALEEKAEQELLKTQKLRLQQQVQAGKITAGESKIIAEASNEYLQLGRALRDAELKYKNLALTQGFSNEQTKEALKQALSIRSVLDKVDTSLGNYGRNVGNYSSAYNGLGNSIQQILRETPSAAVSMQTFFLAISNNLPIFFDEIAKIKEEQKAANIVAQEAAVIAKEEAIAQALATGATREGAIAEGALAEQTVIANAAQTAAPGILKRITGALFSLQSGLTLGVLLLTLFGSQVIAAVSSLIKGTKSTLDLQKAQEDLGEELKNTNKDLSEGIVKLEILNDRVAAGGKSFAEKQEILKDYNVEFADTLGKATSYNEVEKLLRDKTGPYVEAMKLRASAQAALNLATKEEEAILTENIDAETAANNLRTVYFKNKSLYNKDYQTIYKKETELSLQQLEQVRKNNTKVSEDRKVYFEKYYEQLQKQADIIDRVNKIDTDKSDDTKDKKVKHVKDITDAVAELRKELYAIDKQQVTGLIGDNKADLDRLDAYKKALDDIFKRGGNENTPIVKQLLFELSPVNERLLQDEISELVNKLKIDKIELPPMEVSAEDLAKSIIENTKQRFKEITAEGTKVYESDFAELDRNLKNKKLAIKDYIEEKERIDGQSQALELRNDIALNEAIISNLKGLGVSRLDYEIKLNEDKRKLYEQDAKNRILAANKNKKAPGIAGVLGLSNNEADESKAQFINLATAESYNFAKDAMNSYFDAERQQIQANLQLQLERLDNETAQAKAKAQSQAEIDSIDKQAAAKKKKLEQDAFEQTKKSKRSEAKLALVSELANIAVAAANPAANIATLGAYEPFYFGLMSAIALGRYAVRMSEINSQKFALGGKVQPMKNGLITSPSNIPIQPNGDSVLATLKPGEVVLNKWQQALLGGAATFKKIGVPGFGYGGAVGRYPGDVLQAPVFTPAVGNTYFMNNNNELLAEIRQLRADNQRLAEEQSKRIDRLQVAVNVHDINKQQGKVQKQSEIGVL